MEGVQLRGKLAPEPPIFHWISPRQPGADRLQPPSTHELNLAGTGASPRARLTPLSRAVGTAPTSALSGLSNRHRAWELATKRDADAPIVVGVTAA